MCATRIALLRISISCMAVAAAAYAFSPSVAANVFHEFQEITANDATADDRFGIDVAINGNTAVIGAEYGNAAYVFRDNGSGNWNQIAKLTANDTVTTDFFGASVAISGDTAIVGARGNNGSTGAAYVFQEDSLGNWNQIGKLLAGDGAPLDSFGHSIAMSSDTALISAVGDSDRGERSGAAYIFRENSTGTWAEVAKLTSADVVPYNRFGWSLDIKEDTAIVGAIGDIDFSTTPGSAYIFREDAGGSWNQITKLTVDDPTAQLGLAADVAINGNQALISAVYDDDAGQDAGAVFLFDEGANGLWNQSDKLTASDGASYRGFGFTMAMNDDVIAISRAANNNSTNYSNAIYLFRRDEAGAWSEVAMLHQSDPMDFDYFGSSFALSEKSILIGAPLDDRAAEDAGSAYVFHIVPEPNTFAIAVVLATGCCAAPRRFKRTHSQSLHKHR
jgi:FG-GAP repeat